MRIFISSTFEDLEDYRQAAITAVNRLGHQLIAMEYYVAQSIRPLDKVLRDVAASDAFIGLYGFRYGFIPDGQSLSITELELREAERKDIPQFIFLLDEGIAWPEAHVDQGEDDNRIRALREELRRAKLVSFVSSPEDFCAKLTAALHFWEIRILRDAYEKAQHATQSEKARQEAEIARLLAEQREREEQRRRVRRERLAGPAPKALIQHFQDRIMELRFLHGCLGDPLLRLVLVCGKGGMGKSALTSRLIQDLENDYSSSVNSIVYVPLRESDFRSPDKIVSLIGRTLEPEAAEELQTVWKSRTSLVDGLEYLFRRVLSKERCLIVLDNFEDVLDRDNCVSTEYCDLRRFVEACVEYDHSALLVATSRRTLVLSPELEGRIAGRRKELSLDKGLPEDAAKALLRELDPDGKLGLRDASEEALGKVVRRCQCIPRTLEALVGKLRAHPAWNLEMLLADEGELARLVEDPARELYHSLSFDSDRLVMQALAVYGGAVPAAAVRHLLPGLPVDEILDRLVRNHAVTYDARQFSLHPLDSQYAYSQIPEQGESYSRPAMHWQASQFFAKLQQRFESDPKWTSIEDLEPHLQEFYHLVRANQHDRAADVLAAIDPAYLQVWGYYRLVIELREQLLGRLKHPDRITFNFDLLGSAYCNTGMPEKARACFEQALAGYRSGHHLAAEGSACNGLGMAYLLLGDYRQVEDFYRQALVIARRTNAIYLEANCLNGLGDLEIRRGDPRRAIEYLSEALQLNRLIPDRRAEGINLGNLGTAHRMLCDTPNALQLHTEALAIANEVGDRMRRGIHLCSLGRDHTDLGEMTQSLAYLDEAVQIARDVVDRERECLILGDLGYTRTRRGYVSGASTAITEALALADRIPYPRGKIRALTAQGHLYRFKGENSKAVSSYAQAVELARNCEDRFESARALCGQARAYMHTQKLSDARQCCLELLALDLPLCRYRGQVLLGLVASMNGESKAAARSLAEGIIHCRQQLEAVPDYYDARYHLALAQLLEGKAETAIETYRQAATACSAPGVVDLALGDISLLEASPNLPAGITAQILAQLRSQLIATQMPDSAASAI